MPATVSTNIADDKLLQALAERCERAESVLVKNSHQTLADACRDAKRNMQAESQIHSLAEGLNELASQDTRFPGNDILLVNSLGGRSAFYPLFLEVKLLKQALLRRSPQAAIDWALKVLHTPMSHGIHVTALWGAEVDVRVELCPGIFLVPVDTLGTNKQMQMVYGAALSGGGVLPSALDFAPPRSALVVPCTVDPLISRLDAPNTDPLAYQACIDRIHHITLALTVVGPRICIPIASWFSFDDPDIEEALHSTSQTSFMQEIVPLIYSNQTQLDVVEAQRVVSAYLAR